MDHSESDRDGGTESDQPSIRSMEADDADRIREVAEGSMTASYAMSPNEIETVIEEEFGAETLRERAGSDDGDVFVAEREGVLAGFVETAVEDENGVVRWLHVDPERRGRGVGTALFEHAASELEAETGNVRGHVLAPNTSAGAFFERFDFEQVDERTVELGDREAVEYVYADHAGDESATGASADATDLSDVDLPETATSDEGGTVYVGEEHFQGTEGLLVLTYADGERAEKYGYYCTNCETTDVSVDTMDRLKCQTCGNAHNPTEDYDGSYL